ncbi:hypothetical protein [Nonomuraea roseoviolacea]|uniref:Uncharacterized protein n=1 Tax=Nonomuraea roseoviolacea subsp. carminata TaxID=160689 RepID=A0ABT1K551_9ACTN|nr:hypothetical protein [Nonomuraea roseoviolacea]MCP2348561.1 hypothetical protein [Nonomuraea roseoviolacea subsp. carminata]
MTVAQTRSTTTAGTEAGSARRFTLDLPMMTIEVRPPRVRMPRIPLPHVPVPRISRQEMGHAADVARAMLPPPERVAYYGALGALAVMGVIEWPVAAAIGAGAIIAQRARSGETPMVSGGQGAGATARTAPRASTAGRGGGAGGRVSAAARKSAMKAEEAPKSGTSRRGAAAQSAASTQASATKASSARAAAARAASARASSTPEPPG